MLGILFDLDGTLLDTLADLTDGVNYALSRHGLPQRTMDEVRAFVGDGAARLIHRATGGTENWEAVLADFRVYYDAHCRVKTGLYPGIRETVNRLAERFPVAVVSNKPDSAVKLLCADYFPGVLAMGESPACPRKPDPAMLRLAMERLGVDRCVYVGDSEVDVLTARNAGVPCVSVLWGFRDLDVLEQAGAKYLCHNPWDLERVILSIGEHNGQ